jgi:hypothetical protein
MVYLSFMDLGWVRGPLLAWRLRTMAKCAFSDWWQRLPAILPQNKGTKQTQLSDELVYVGITGATNKRVE